MQPQSMRRPGKSCWEEARGKQEKRRLVCSVWPLKAQRRNLKFPKTERRADTFSIVQVCQGFLNFACFPSPLLLSRCSRVSEKQTFEVSVKLQVSQSLGNAGATLRVSLALCLLLFRLPSLTVQTCLVSQTSALE